MFTFSEEEYKWCVECQGNIRRDAYYCKFCRKPVGSKLMAAKAPGNVSGLITDAAQWLPNFGDILDAIPAPFRGRIDHVDASGPVPFVGLKPGLDPVESRTNTRNSSICAPTAPSNAVLGLVLDILISLQAQELPLSTICSDPRLQLLELSVGEIVAEHELRVSEIQGGHNCPHCAEFVRSDGEQCRFCTGTEKELPQASDESIMMEISCFDPTLLRSILVWEAATRRLNDQSPLPAEILSSHEITEDEIDLQILKLRQNPKFLPISRWRERMLQLGISPGYFEDDQLWRSGWDFEYFILADVTSLARALTPSFVGSLDKTNVQEALIVVDHGLTRWQSNRHYETEKHQLLTAKSMVYLNLKDDENFNKYKKEADQLLLKSLPEGYKDLIEIDLERKPIELNADPAMRLKDLEDLATELLQKAFENTERMDKLVPGLADAFKGIGELANSVFEISRHTLKAQAALKNSDPETACAEFEAAINLGGTDNMLDISGRCGLLVQLAEAQFQKGDANSAEATFQRALSDAADLTEAKSAINPASTAYHRYAAFLRDTGNYAGAEEYFTRAFDEHAELISGYIAKGYVKPEHPTESWQIKEDFAKLLRAMGRDDEAEKTEAESKVLKEKDPQEIKERETKLE
ncbi:hypothetical protein BH10CYA1_BH10CYA1_25130 [soil metagenome]